MASVAIIGAGLAGSIAGRALQSAGHDVVLFDKGRGPGGRMSTRRAGPFDHGAQYFTARGAAFRAEVDAWCAAGVAARWPLRVGVFDARGLRPKHETQAPLRFVGLPGMNRIVAQAQDGLDVRFETRIAEVQVGAQVELTDAGGGRARADALLVAIPAPQAADLLESCAPGLARRARAVRMTPCWALMTELSEPAGVPFDGIFVNEGPLSWVARDTSKPGRPEGERWVLHASPTWTAAHLEEPPEAIAAALEAAFTAVTGFERPMRSTAHRWRYALASEPLEVGTLSAPHAPRLALAGDWLAGSRVEGAYESGRAAAAHILETL